MLVLKQWFFLFLGNIGKIDELVKFQMGRLQEERNSLAVSLFRAGQVQAGVYALVPRGEIVLEPRPDLFVSDKPCWLEKPSSKNT